MMGSNLFTLAPGTCLADSIPQLLLLWVQLSSLAPSCPTLCDLMDCSMPGLPVHHQLLEFTQTNVHWVGDAIQPSHPLSSLSPPASIFPSIRVFSNESVPRIRWPRCWSFSFSISSSNDYSGLISFRMDWLNFLAIQRTVKSLLQHHISKASILRWSAFFIVQLSYPYMTTGKTIVLTRWTFVGKVMSLLFNMLSRLVIAFFPRSKLNSFNFMAVVTVCSDFGAHKNKVCHCFHCFPIYLPWSDKLILKFVMKCKGPRLWKTTLKKNKARGSKLPDFKNHYTSSVMKTVWYLLPSRKTRISME